MAAPPVCHALFLSFQVSEPGSPGAGTVYFRHSTLPVAASGAAMHTAVSPDVFDPAAAETVALWTAVVAQVTMKRVNRPDGAQPLHRARSRHGREAKALVKLDDD